LTGALERRRIESSGHHMSTYLLDSIPSPVLMKVAATCVCLTGCGGHVLSNDGAIGASRDGEPEAAFADSGLVMEAGSGGHAGETGSDAASQPWSDPSWSPDCGMQAATVPSQAAPLLQWTECSPDLPGCTMLVPDWPHNGAAFTHTPQLYKDGSTLRLSLHLWWAGFEQRHIIVDEHMSAVAVWRQEPKAPCTMKILQWTTRHVCLSVQRVDHPTREVLLSTEDLTGPAIADYGSESIEPVACNEELFVGHDAHPRVRDLQTGEEFSVVPQSGDGDYPQIHGSIALFPVYDVNVPGGTASAWVWERPNSVRKLVDPAPDYIYDIRTDGAVLAWSRVKPLLPGDPAPGELWTAPLTTDPGALKPKFVRALPPTAPWIEASVVGGGYYATLERKPSTDERFLHVYRLSDGRHWSVLTPQGLVPGATIWLDADEIWFVGEAGAPMTILRQQLSALGPGD
jgi:hypothetical protein